MLGLLSECRRWSTSQCLVGGFPIDVVKRKNIERELVTRTTRPYTIETTKPLIPPFPTKFGVVNAKSNNGPRVWHGTASVIPNATACNLFVRKNVPHSQPTLEGTRSWNKNKHVETMTGANFLYFFNIPFNVTRTLYWKCMVNAIVVYGPRFKLPPYNKLWGPIL